MPTSMPSKPITNRLPMTRTMGLRLAPAMVHTTSIRLTWEMAYAPIRRKDRVLVTKESTVSNSSKKPETSSPPRDSGFQSGSPATSLPKGSLNSISTRGSTTTGSR